MNDKIKVVPLKVNVDERGYYSINPREGGLTIARLDILDPYSPVAAAYADLFATAPDMLEALEDAYKIIRRHENPDLPGSAELRAIKSIIKRATGRKIDEVIND